MTFYRYGTKRKKRKSAKGKCEFCKAAKSIGLLKDVHGKLKRACSICIVWESPLELY